MVNKEIVRYRRIVKRNLHCSRSKRRELLAQFEYSLSCFLEDCPAPDYAQLTDAFGPPEEMACILMQNVQAEEQERYRKGRFFFRISAGLIAVLLVSFAIHVFFDKEYSVVVIYDELTPMQTMIGTGGH